MGAGVGIWKLPQPPPLVRHCVSNIPQVKDMEPGKTQSGCLKSCASIRQINELDELPCSVVRQSLVPFYLKKDPRVLHDQHGMAAAIQYSALPNPAHSRVVHCMEPSSPGGTGNSSW